MEAILDKATKKKLGSFYSPAVLANYLASKANEYFHRDKESLSFLDPAVGDGELLKAMFVKIQQKLILVLILTKTHWIILAFDSVKRA